MDDRIHFVFHLGALQAGEEMLFLISRQKDESRKF